ncbi:MAG: hypothetical protein A2603_14705 [Bdellovibrionales bacterium RIFOXYD1_FULL_55_31]|nr:MAG: hypothetical protein A2603_14705 [Bdellovibrionales bacterium RIFOXYD1_FULL_55_31]
MNFKKARGSKVVTFSLPFKIRFFGNCAEKRRFSGSQHSVVEVDKVFAGPQYGSLESLGRPAALLDAGNAFSKRLLAVLAPKAPFLDLRKTL